MTHKSDFTDEQARKLATILGDGLVAQLTNARYMLNRGYPDAALNVRRLEHAQRIRDEDRLKAAGDEL